MLTVRESKMNLQTLDLRPLFERSSLTRFLVARRPFEIGKIYSNVKKQYFKQSAVSIVSGLARDLAK